MGKQDEEKKEADSEEKTRVSQETFWTFRTIGVAQIQ